MTAVADPLRMLEWILADHPGDSAAELRAAVQRVLDGDELSLDAALGLKPAAGQRSWKTTASIEERDRLIRETAAQYFPDKSIREKADSLAKGLERFRVGADWQCSRYLDACPYPQGLKANFWLILKVLNRPLSAESLRKIVGNELGLFVTQQADDDSSNDP